LGNFSLDLPKDPSMNALVIAHDDYSPIEAKAIDGDSLVVRLQEEEVAEVKTMSQKRVSFPGSAPRSFASPADGERSYQRYIKQNLRYPSEAKAARIHGKVIVEFDVTEDGSPTNLRIIRSLGYGCDEEAMRLVRTGPKWKSSQGSIGRREIDF
jgi:TonB family protein